MRTGPEKAIADAVSMIEAMGNGEEASHEPPAPATLRLRGIVEESAVNMSPEPSEPSTPSKPLVPAAVSESAAVSDGTLEEVSEKNPSEEVGKVVSDKEKGAHEEADRLKAAHDELSSREEALETLVKKAESAQRKAEEIMKQLEAKLEAQAKKAEDDRRVQMEADALHTKALQEAEVKGSLQRGKMKASPFTTLSRLTPSRLLITLI